MASRVFLKKGGTARLEIENFQNLDSFVVPAGFRIENLTVKKSGTTAGNIKAGNYIDAIAEELDIVVTAAPTASGNITVTLRGGTPVLIPVTGAESIAQTVTKIAAGVYPGYTVAGTLGTTVTWTATVAGAKIGVTTVTGPTGFAKTGVTEQVVGTDATAGEQTVASVALSTVNNNITDLTVVKKLYAADTEIFIAVSSAATGTLIAQLQKLF